MNFDAIKRAVAELGNAIATRQAKREALAQERDRIAALPMARADLVAAVCQWVDGFKPLYARHLETVIKPHSRRADRALPDPRHGDFGLLGDASGVMPVPILALLGGPLKVALADCIRDLPLDDATALLKADRTAKLADLDSKIEALDLELAELHEQAASAGLAKVRRQPTREEIDAVFAHGTPTDALLREHAIENLRRQINGEPRLPAPPLPPARATLIPDKDLPPDF